MNTRVINLCLCIAIVVSMLLGILVALEDHEVWGILQFVGFAAFYATLGVAFAHAAAKLVKE
jgi:hypothetical protein